jgi:hypothetical protein
LFAATENNVISDSALEISEVQSFDLLQFAKEIEQNSIDEDSLEDSGQYKTQSNDVVIDYDTI